MIDKEQVLKIAGEPVAWVDTMWPEHGLAYKARPTAFKARPLYTEAAAHAAILAAYAKGAEDANRVLYDFVGRDFAHLEPRQALESHSIETRKENRDE